MKFLVQRVSHAEVAIDGKVKGSIGCGFLVLIGISQKDTQDTADKMLKKLLNLRIFEDTNGKTNLGLKDVNGELMMISQFTLYADCKHGNRPSFIYAGKPEPSKTLYEYIIAQAKLQIPVVEQGEFGADMKVSLLNDGPFTIMLDSEML